MGQIKSSQTIKKKNYVAVINTITSKYGIKYHVYINKKKGKYYKNAYPSKTFNTKLQARIYIKNFMREH